MHLPCTCDAEVTSVQPLHIYLRWWNSLAMLMTEFSSFFLSSVSGSAAAALPSATAALPSVTAVLPLSSLGLGGQVGPADSVVMCDVGRAEGR